MRVLTFSRFYPGYHPKKGQPTYFVEQICRGIHAWTTEGKELCDLDVWAKDNRKYHTIRAGHRWKVGDWFSPRVWSGKPYASKQIEIAPPIEIKKIFDFMVVPTERHASYFVNDKEMISVDFVRLCRNDGLEPGDLEDWFRYKPMEGQVICWNDQIEY